MGLPVSVGSQAGKVQEGQMLLKIDVGPSSMIILQEAMKLRVFLYKYPAFSMFWVFLSVNTLFSYPVKQQHYVQEQNKLLKTETSGNSGKFPGNPVPESRFHRWGSFNKCIFRWVGFLGIQKQPSFRVLQRRRKLLPKTQIPQVRKKGPFSGGKFPGISGDSGVPETPTFRCQSILNVQI